MTLQHKAKKYRNRNKLFLIFFSSKFYFSTSVADLAQFSDKNDNC